MQLCGNAVGQLIDLTVGEALIGIDECECVRGLGYLRFEEREDGLRVVVRHSRLVEAVEQRCLGLVHERDGTEGCLGLSSKRTEGIAD